MMADFRDANDNKLAVSLDPFSHLFSKWFQQIVKICDDTKLTKMGGLY